MTAFKRKWGESCLEGDNLLPNLMARVEVDWDTGCWRWTGTVDSWGYGRMAGNAGAGIHRFMYRETVGEIPDGLDLDHGCHNIDLDCPGGTRCLHRRCVNPDHLEPVTRKVNVRRAQTVVRKGGRAGHCNKGHAYDDENTYVSPKGQRNCRACNRAAVLAYAERKHAERAAVRRSDLEAAA